ncbi:MAG: helix-turn-helix domain-containing protein [Clostridia bacterium]|nr:helix-turn-helix domain-containing protein [Clostridia bacterium]
MFDKKAFAEILNNIYKTYTNQRDFADSTGVNRAYLSQYMNEKLENPPTPKILEKIANASKGLTTYSELMLICGYFENNSDNYNLLARKDELEEKLNNLKLTSKESTFINNLLKKYNEAIDIFKEKYSNLSNVPESEIKKVNKEILKDLNYNMFSFSVFGFIRIAKAFDLLSEINDIDNDLKLFFNSLENTEQEQKFEKIIENTFYNCPVYGRISAGIPNWAEECLESYLPLDPNLMNINNPEECFFLRVNGESMNKLVRNGSYALIRKQDVVENGDIAAVLVNGYDATLKKFTKHGDVIVLEPMSDDPNFQTQIYDKNTDIKILGKYLGKFELN